MADSFSRNVASLRLKDIERLCLAMMLYNFVPEGNSDILDRFCRQLRTKGDLLTSEPPFNTDTRQVHVTAKFSIMVHKTIDKLKYRSNIEEGNDELSNMGKKCDIRKLLCYNEGSVYN